MKKITLGTFSVLFYLLLGISSAYATSGACSSHGGVDCNYKSSTGSAICNDGWDSSVSYSSMVECRAENRCSRPTTEECSEARQSGLMVQALQNGSAQYTPDIAQGQIQACKNQDARYHVELNAYNSCVRKSSNPQIYPTRPQITTTNNYQNNAPQQVVNDPRRICIMWQASHGYVADGLCCSEAKGIIIAFAQEHPELCTISKKEQTSVAASKKTEQKVAPTITAKASENSIEKPSVSNTEPVEPTVPQLVTNPPKQSKFLSFLKKLMFWKR